MQSFSIITFVLFLNFTYSISANEILYNIDTDVICKSTNKNHDDSSSCNAWKNAMIKMGHNQVHCKEFNAASGEFVRKCFPALLIVDKIRTEVKYHENLDSKCSEKCEKNYLVAYINYGGMNKLQCFVFGLFCLFMIVSFISCIYIIPPPSEKSCDGGLDFTDGFIIGSMIDGWGDTTDVDYSGGWN
tara:strand:- start:418 stop:978 length:561 start_codon:yes stop_codon:yes gene_type:complete